MPPKRTTPFQNAHALRFAVRPTQCGSASSHAAVVSAECLFCVYFGRENKVGQKRARTCNIKYFKAPFRADNYKQHHCNQHPERWKEYQEADNAGKKSFFEEHVPVKKTLHGHFGTKQVQKIFLINAPIVDVIIGDMLWDPEDIEGQTHARMMASFRDTADESEALPEGQGSGRYMVVIKNRLQFFIAIDYLSVGLTFRMASRVLHSTKERSGLASIGACTDVMISKYARYACAVNLQKICELLEKAWTFSVALDMSTHMSTSYLDMRIRLHLNKHGIVNVHVLAIPVFERHTAQVIFDTAAKALDALFPSWRDVIVGISTEGERKMTGRITGVPTRFQNVAKPGFIRIWCDAHQLDIVLQASYSELANETFYGQLTSLISYLRRQQNLIAAMRAKAPKVSDTRWESMGNVSKWFKKNRIGIVEHIEQKNPACAPSHEWWILLMVTSEFSSLATTAFKSLQGHQVTVAMQRSTLVSLRTSLLRTVGGRGPLSESEAAALHANPDIVLSECRLYSVSLSKTKEFLMDLGSFVTSRIALLEAQVVDQLVKDVANLYLSTTARVAKIVAERDAANESDAFLPPVVPSQLIKISHYEFCNIVATHRERMTAAGWTAASIDAMEQEHRELIRAAASEPALKDAIEACKEGVSFADGWSIVKGRFESLHRFVGGLASVFPGTSQVESDFSIVKCEKNNFRTAMTDLSLEGFLHSKQFSMLELL